MIRAMQAPCPIKHTPTEPPLPLLRRPEAQTTVENSATFVVSFPLLLYCFIPDLCCTAKLPGQRASACTCPGEDHPGPNVNVGRGAPEIDAIEAQVDYRLIGSASQSIQIAPMDAGYLWKNTTPYIEIWNDTGTFQS